MTELTVDLNKFLKSGLRMDEYILLQLVAEGKEDAIRLLQEDNFTKIQQNLLYLQKELFIKIVGDTASLRTRGQNLFPEEKSVTFDDFWSKYHEVTRLPKTDREPAKKYWKSLRAREKQNAIDNVSLYFDNLDNKKYCKKARTYLRDKNFNDDYKTDTADSSSFVQNA